MDDGPVGALRVSQLDASELDDEIFRITKLQISGIFKYHTTSLLAKFDPEINAAIKSLLWKFTLRDRNATVGQQILGVYYGHAKGHNSGSAISPREKILYALLVIFCPWLRERLSILLTCLGLSSLDEQVHWWLEQGQTVLKVAALINLLVFLRRGVYRNLMERLLAMRSYHPKRQGLRQVGFEYMSREILWHGFSEFLFFLLPLINFQRIKNTVRGWVLGQKSSAQGHLQHRSKADLLTCAVCEQWPTMPREIGCRHVFCYYCVAANLKADPNFSCPACGHAVVSYPNIQQVKTHINPGRLKD